MVGNIETVVGCKRESKPDAVWTNRIFFDFKRSQIASQLLGDEEWYGDSLEKYDVELISI